ncbi:MAG: hypothetical protein HY689_10730 [Chloroflexi bacterium]|nr:hypothetical protein [Chloroflexota bacterium]
MSTQCRFAAVVILSAFLSVACLSFEPPPPRVLGLTSTPTLTSTPIPFAATATATPELAPGVTVTVTPQLTPGVTITTTPQLTPGTGTPVVVAPPGTTPGVGRPATSPTLVPPIFPGPGGSVLPPIPGGSGPGTVPGGTAGGGASAGPLPPTIISWECNGDERMDFIPPAPAVGDDLYITVTSGGDHGYVQLQGPLPFDKVLDGWGGPGRFWQWKKRADKVGAYVFEFYSGPRREHRCVTGTVQVQPAGSPTATPTPRILPTPTPSSTPRPDH